jgi:DNA-binding HxlR family transcriptional regulator
MKITLIQLCHHRWIIPILAELHQQNGGSKFVTLVNRLELSRDSLSRTLQIMLELHLIERNTVYAHPLRPEYILMAHCKDLAKHAHALMPQLEPQETLLNKWALPTIHALQSHNRFSRLLEVLPNITSRALTMILKDLEQHGYVRHEKREYSLSEHGQALAKAAALLGVSSRVY